MPHSGQSPVRSSFFFAGGAAATGAGAATGAFGFRGEGAAVEVNFGEAAFLLAPVSNEKPATLLAPKLVAALVRSGLLGAAAGASSSSSSISIASAFLLPALSCFFSLGVQLFVKLLLDDEDAAAEPKALFCCGASFFVAEPNEGNLLVLFGASTSSDSSSSCPSYSSSSSALYSWPPSFSAVHCACSSSSCSSSTADPNAPFRLFPDGRASSSSSLRREDEEEEEECDLTAGVEEEVGTAKER
jgi:hypothetical protein